MSTSPILLISMESAVLRRARMSAQLKAQALDFEVIGCDFRRSARPAIAAWFAAHLPTVRPGALALSGAELGCWASHLTAWTRIALSRRGAGTVIEDDLILAPEFADCVRALEADLADFDLVYLGTSSRSLSMRRITPIGDLRIHAPVGVVLNTWGYVVRTRWIERVLAQPSFALTMPIDHFLGGRAAVARPRIGVLQPVCVDEDATTGRISQIAPHTWRVDRLRIVEASRRRFLRSRAGDWMQRIAAWL
jgi:glycosyl transferase family 25